LKQNGRELDTERLVGTLENLRYLDIGLGTPDLSCRCPLLGVKRTSK